MGNSGSKNIKYTQHEARVTLKVADHIKKTYILLEKREQAHTNLSQTENTKTTIQPSAFFNNDSASDLHVEKFPAGWKIGCFT